MVTTPSEHPRPTASPVECGRRCETLLSRCGFQCSGICHTFEQRPLRKTRRGVRFRYFLFLRAGPLTSLTPSAWWGVCLPGLPGRWWTGRGNGRAPHRLRMRSDVVLRKQLCFLQRLQKPTPCLPRHIFAAEGEKLPATGVSLMSLGSCRLRSPADIRELAQEGLGGK